MDTCRSSGCSVGQMLYGEPRKSRLDVVVRNKETRGVGESYILVKTGWVTTYPGSLR